MRKSQVEEKLRELAERRAERYLSRCRGKSREY
jgi:hypothetical protein